MAKQQVAVVDRVEEWDLPAEPGPEVDRLHAVKGGGYYVRDEVFTDMWRLEGHWRREYFYFVLAREGRLVEATDRT